MANLKDVIYLSNEDYATLVTTGTVTIDGTTLTYDENNLYITPDRVISLESVNSYSAGTVSYISDVSGGGASGSGTTKYLHFSAGSTPSSSSFTYATGSFTTAASMNFNTGTTTDNKYVYEISSTGASASGTDTFVKTISGGSGTFTPTTRYLSASFSGSSATTTEPLESSSVNVASTSHDHTITPSGSVSLTANGETATGRITYVQSISSTGASVSSTAKGGSETHTHTYDKTTGVTLTANDASSTGRIQYIQDVTHTAASLTGTTTFNTDAIKSVSLSASTTSTDGPAYIESITGGSAVSPTTKYMKFSAGTTPASSASFSGTAATITPTLSAGTTKYLSASFSGTAATITPTLGAGTTKYLSASFSGTAATITPTLTGTTTFVTGYASFSGGSGTFYGTRSTSGTGTSARRKLTITHTHTAASLGSPTTKTVGISGASYTPAGSITLTANDSTGTGRIQYLQSQGTITGASYTPAGSITLTANDATATGRIQYLQSQGTITGASYTPSGSISLTAGTAPSMNFNTGNTSDTPYVSSISGGSAINPVTKYMKNVGTSATTKTVGISGGSITKTTKYLSASPSTTSTDSGTPSATTSFATGVTGGTTTATTKYLSASFSGTEGTTSGPMGSDSMTSVASYDHQHNVTATGSVSLTANTSTATGRITYLESATHTHTGASVASSGTAVTGVQGGTTTPTYRYMKFTTPVLATSTAYQITDVGSVPSLTSNDTASGGITYLQNYTTTGSSVSKTTKYMKVKED